MIEGGKKQTKNSTLIHTNAKMQPNLYHRGYEKKCAAAHPVTHECPAMVDYIRAKHFLRFTVSTVFGKSSSCLPIC